MNDVPFSLPDGIIWTRYCVAQCTRCKCEEDVRRNAPQTLTAFCAAHAMCKASTTRQRSSMTIREEFAAEMMAALITTRHSNLTHPRSASGIARQAKQLAKQAVVYADALLAELAPDEAHMLPPEEFERAADEASRKLPAFS